MEVITAHGVVRFPAYMPVTTFGMHISDVRGHLVQ